MDEVLSEYSSSIEPALCGDDKNKRNVQKQKRHLEAWLWARRFHPLLPLGKPPRSALLAANRALAAKLKKTGLKPREARKRVRRLAKVARRPPVAVEGDVTVSEERANKRVTVCCKGRRVELFAESYEKLRGMCKAADFKEAAFLMLARYRVLQVHEKGGGNQGAVPERVMRIWEGHGPVLEAFASPLNALTRNFCSAFFDVDEAFGARGSFFEEDLKEGLLEVNPPFDEELVMRTAEAMDAALQKAASGKRLLAFLVVVPRTDWPGHARMLACKFKRWERTLPAGQHYYQVGNQHKSETGSYVASRDTTLLLLSSQAIAGEAGLAERIEAAFRAVPPK